MGVEGGRGSGWVGRGAVLFSKCVNKSLFKLSGPKPGVFTASVSITNKSRPFPPTPPHCPPSAACHY